MNPLRSALVALVALATLSGARAQVMIDVAKITCDQFTLY